MTDGATDTYSDDEPLFVQRWIEKPYGRFELVEIPLTPEVFLDPHPDDKMLEGVRHSESFLDLYSYLKDSLRAEEGQDVRLLPKVKHIFGAGLPAPRPDLSVVFGLRQKLESYEEWPEDYDIVRDGVRPSMILEILSPLNARLREVDEVDKFEAYQTAGIPEYFLVDTPRRRNGFRFSVKGFRLDSEGRYQPIHPDPEGRLLSEQTGLLFSVVPDPEGNRVVLADASTGEVLLTRTEIWKALRAAEERAEREAEARRAAEAEIARLRERLKETGG